MKKIIPVILAGGIGERFWPLSRSSFPKQLLALTSHRAMIEEALSRARAVQSRDAAPLLITGKPIAPQIQQLLAGKLRYDLIVEPVGKNTAPAIALAAAWIQARYGDSIMVVLPADHLVRPIGAFVKAVRRACVLADTKDAMVVFGVKPSRPETGYGYLQIKKKQDAQNGIAWYPVARFIEKPDAARAARYCASASYLWNSGMFVWKTGVVLREVKTYMPALFSLVAETVRHNFSRKAIDRFYRSAEKKSIDYGIMERSRRVRAVAGGFLWDDIGSWESLARFTGATQTGTTVAGDHIFEQECRDSIIVNRSPHTLAVIGCSATAVIATGDAILVISRSKLPYLKRYLGEMKKSRRFPSRLF